MTTLVIPPLDAKPWPSLGRQVCDFIEANLVFGPGDLRGDRARLDDEKRALIYRMYEVFPRDHPQAGRRRFNRCAISLRKGTAKTELLAWVAAVELHSEGPVRCDGWRWRGHAWEPVGRPVRDPYIPLVAYTEEQSEDLAFGALYAILAESPIADDFDIGLERIMRIGGDGKAVALASTPNARDGARTTFEGFDETHRFTLPGHRRTHKVMLANLPKRRAADPWALEITVAYGPGENSVAEGTFDYARRVARGELKDSRLFFFHRGAGDAHDITTADGLRAAVLEASGPTASWSDIDGIVAQFSDPDADRAYLERVWLNRIVRRTEGAFDAERWRSLARPEHAVPDGAMVTLGFDGARFWDATAIVATEIATGFQWPLGIWERPPEAEAWEVPADEVEAVIADAFERYEVWRMYADPPKWESNVSAWQGAFGDRVLAWWTNRWTLMTRALRNYTEAMRSGEVTHSGDPQFTEHVGAAVRRHLTLRDDEGQPMWVITKERPDSLHKIDAAMAGCLSWQARTDALSAGALSTTVWTAA